MQKHKNRRIIVRHVFKIVPIELDVTDYIFENYSHQAILDIKNNLFIKSGVNLQKLVSSDDYFSRHFSELEHSIKTSLFESTKNFFNVKIDDIAALSKFVWGKDVDDEGNLFAFIDSFFEDSLSNGQATSIQRVHYLERARIVYYRLLGHYPDP